MNMTIKTGDNVVVIAGKDKGKTGKVLKVYADEHRVLVDNVNIVSKHQKPKSQQDKGGIIKKSAPIDISNVMVVCPVCGKATRVAHSQINGKKVRICKKCNTSLDKEYVKQSKKEAKKAVKAEELKGAKLKSVSTENKSTKDKAEKAKVEKEEVTEKQVEKKSTAKASVKKAAEKKPSEKTAEKKTAEKKTTSTKKSTAKKEDK